MDRFNKFKTSDKLKKNNRWCDFQSSENSQIKSVSKRFNNFGDSEQESGRGRDSDRWGDRGMGSGRGSGRGMGSGRDSGRGMGSGIGSRGRDSGRKRFGKNRIYKSIYNKEETLEYFKQEKNATRKQVSLFECVAVKQCETKNKKDKVIENDKVIEKDEIIENKMSKAERDFIVDKYMYEEDSEEEFDEIEVERNEEIIDF